MTDYNPPSDLQPMGSIPTPTDKNFRCPDCNGTGIIQKVQGNITGKFGMVELGIRDTIPETTMMNAFGGFEEMPCPKCVGSK